MGARATVIPGHLHTPGSQGPTLERLLVESAPPTPACFDGPSEWHQWIVLAHVSGDPVIRRQELGRLGGRRQTRAVMVIAPFRFCEDCTAQYQARMAQAGRCEWILRHDADELPPPLLP